MKIDIDLLIPNKQLSGPSQGVLYLHTDQLRYVLELLDETDILWGNGDKPSNFEVPTSEYISLFFYNERRGLTMYYEGYDNDCLERLKETHMDKVFELDEVLVESCVREEFIPLSLAELLEVPDED